jgi:hypothetical protein
MLSEEPNLQRLRNDIALPIEAMSQIERQVPMRSMPNIEIALPKRANDLSDKADPPNIVSSTERREPNLATP